jgi:hypothetical protein
MASLEYDMGRPMRGSTYPEAEVQLTWYQRFWQWLTAEVPSPAGEDLDAHVGVLVSLNMGHNSL